MSLLLAARMKIILPHWFMMVPIQQRMESIVFIPVPMAFGQKLITLKLPMIEALAMEVR